MQTALLHNLVSSFPKFVKIGTPCSLKFFLHLLFGNILVLLMVEMVYAQEVLLEGHIYEAGKDSPIPFANISFLNSLKGTSSNEEGYFYMDIPETYLPKKIHISSLGFKDTIVTAAQIRAKQKIRLREETYELDEVVVAHAMGNVQVLNPISSYDIKSGFTSAATPWVLALYFPNIGAAKKYVEQVTVFLQKNAKFTGQSRFRLRVFGVNPNNKKPGNDILRKNVILESDPDKDFVSIDLSEFGIQVPREGIYVGLEWIFLPYNWYVVNYEHPITKNKVVEDHFAPTFAAVYQKNQNYRTMVYGLGEWSDFIIKAPDNKRNLVPAISVKVSKK